MTTPTRQAFTHPTDQGSTAERVGGAVSAMSTLAGVGLTAGPVVFLAGLLASPSGDTTDTASSIHAFAANPTQSQASSLLLHYGLILMALGLLRVPSLVAHRRGSVMVLLGSLGASIGMLNVSGSLKDDWWRMAAAQVLSDWQAVALVDQADSASLLVLWSFTEMIAFLGVLVLLAGLARAHVLSWAWPTVAVLAFGATMAIPGNSRSGRAWPSACSWPR